MSDTIMARLRSETKASHQELEKATIPYIKNATTNEAYAQLLQLFLGYFKPLETKIHRLITSELIPDIDERRQSSAILSDLEVIGGSQPAYVFAEHLPVVETIPQALGAMYVMEGSTLGGRIISQMLSKQLQREATSGISFFSGYREQTDAKWKTFADALNEYNMMHPLNANEIVAAAEETFSKFGEWVAIFGEKAKQSV